MRTHTHTTGCSYSYWPALCLHGVTNECFFLKREKASQDTIVKVMFASQSDAAVHPSTRTITRLNGAEVDH